MINFLIVVDLHETSRPIKGVEGSFEDAQAEAKKLFPEITHFEQWDGEQTFHAKFDIKSKGYYYIAEQSKFGIKLTYPVWGVEIWPVESEYNQVIEKTK